MWGLGLCSVAVISLSGLFGGLFWPLINSNFYNQMMRILIGLAVGSLSATSTFQLIPEVRIQTSNGGIQNYNWFTTTKWQRKVVNRRNSVHSTAEMPKARYNMTHSLFQGFQIKNDERYLSTAVFMWGSLWILYIFEVLSKILLHKQDVSYFFSSFLPLQTGRLWNCDLRSC